jgi:heterodisulfide reductase subunit C
MQAIDSKELDAQFKHEVAARPGGENIKLCFACGTCTAGCPVSEIDSEFDPRRIIRKVLLGMRKEVLSSPLIWRCVQCYACTSKCPQNVKFREVMRALREMAVEEGHAKPALLKEVEELGNLTQTLRRNMARAMVSSRREFKKLKGEVEALSAEQSS